MTTFPQTADITQAYFLSVMFYLMVLQNFRLDKMGSNLQEGSGYLQSIQGEEVLHAHFHLFLTPLQEEFHGTGYGGCSADYSSVFSACPLLKQ